MALDENIMKKFLNRLDNLQKEIESIHRDLMLEMESDRLSKEEIEEIKAIREKNEYKTLEEWRLEEESAN